MKNFFVKTIFLFKLFEITYNFYKYNNIDYENWTNYCKLNKFYISNTEDLWIDSNFSKYGLITIDSNYELLDSIQPRIYNKKLNISIILNGFIDTSLLKLLFSLKEKGVISILSLKPQYNIYLEGKIEHDLSLEAVQFGKLFDFTKLKDLVPTKLYNENKDVFWVNVNNCEINFEEILYDFRVYKNQIITQVVHLIFYEENKNYYISHIDHEFIFYSYDEFDKKSKDIYQNGTAQKRHKTFKVDKSKIPFNEDNKPKFLLTVLYTFFYQKELINEYFEKYT